MSSPSASTFSLPVRADGFATARPGGIAFPEERLARGIWPRSIAVWMVGIYVGLFIIRPWEMLFPQLGTIRFERLFAGAMLIALILDGFRLRLNSQSVAVLGLLAAMFASAVFAFDTTVAYGVLYTYLTLVIFFFALLSAARGPYALCFLVTCYIVAMGLYLAKAMWEYYLHGTYFYAMGVKRLIGIEYTFGGPNELASSIVLSMPMLVYLFSIRKQYTATWPKLPRQLFPYCLAVYFMMACWAIMLTNSRSGMISFVLFAFLIAMRGRGVVNKAVYIGGALLLLGVLWAVMPEVSKNRLSTIWDPSKGPANAHESAMGRIVGFKIGMTIFGRFPVLGVGPGNFIPYRMRHVDGGIWDPHNLAGQVLSEIGIVGTAAFVVMVLVALSQCQRAIRSGQRCHDPVAELGWRMGYAARETIIILCFDGLFGHNLLRFTWLWAAAFATLAVSQIRTLQRKERMSALRDQSTQVRFALP